MFDAVKASVKSLMSDDQLRSLDRILSRQRFLRTFGMRYYQMSVFKSVEGFLLDEEAVTLYDLAASLQAPNSCVVEIGSWLGKSSVVIGSALKRKPRATLFCIDPFDGSGDDRSRERYGTDADRMTVPLRATFDANLRRAGVESVVQVRPGYSADIASSWTSTIDMLFIDGNHEYDDVRSDFRSWSRFIKPEGFVAFHDTYLAPPTKGKPYHEGPGRVVTECVASNRNWETICHVRSLFVARKVRQ